MKSDMLTAEQGSSKEKSENAHPDGAVNSNNQEGVCEASEQNDINMEHEISASETREQVLKMIEEAKSSCDNEMDQQPEQGAVDIRIVVKMFAELKNEIKMLRQSKDFEISGDLKAELESLGNSMQNTDEEVESLRSQLDEFKIRTTILTGAMGRMNLVMNDMQSKIDRLESAQSRRMVTVSGFMADTRKDVRKAQLELFFKNDIQVEVHIEDSYLMGENNPPLIAVTFNTAEERKQILENKHRIKDYVNTQDQKIYIREFQTANAQEIRKREREVIGIAKEQNPQVDISRSKEGLKIQNQVYRKRIKVPDPTEILQLSESELESVLNMCLSKSKKLVLKDNTFIAYTLCTDSYEEIEKAYMNIKLANAGARHVACAWYIPNEEKHLECDYQDDEEYGCGRILAQILSQFDIKFRAIFVARYYAGKIGPERFDAYMRCAISVINQAPYNAFVHKDQQVNLEGNDAKLTPGPKIQHTTPSKSPPQKKFLVEMSQQEKRGQYDDMPSFQRGRGYQNRGFLRGRGRGRGNNRGGGQPRRLFAPVSPSTATANKLQHQKQGHSNNAPFNFSAPKTRQ